MKYFFVILGTLLCLSGLAQNPGSDYFKPYQYPKHYSHDGAYQIMEMNAFLPNDTLGWGGSFQADIVSVKLGTPALRLNLGLGFGYQQYSTKKLFAPTPLLDGTLGENSLTDKHQILTVQVYPRLWIRVADPINISLSGGPLWYSDNNQVEGTYTLHDVVYGKNTFTLSSKETLPGWGYFYEARVMLNFKNNGISGGLTSINLNGKTITQPTVGLWFGLGTFQKVIN